MGRRAPLTHRAVSRPHLCPEQMHATVIIRARNEEPTIQDTLVSVRDQTVESEIIVVDSESTDATAAVATDYCDTLITIRSSEFTYGKSLNVGASAARGDILFALSAHCTLPTRHWIEWSLAAYTNPVVGGTHGGLYSPDGRQLDTSMLAGIEDLATDLEWGFSNHASSWRTDLWRKFPFNEDLGACEDKEWMWRVCGAGWKIMVDPRLAVPTLHRRAAGPRRLFIRTYKEHRSLAQFLDYQPMPFSRFPAVWWSSFPGYSPHPHWKRRLNPLRFAELLGALVGDHAGARHRFPEAIKVQRS